MGNQYTGVSAIERFEQKYIPEPNSGCWLWVGADKGDGYGSFRSDSGRHQGPHRWIMEQVHGHIPSDRVIDHKCRVRSCVNPDHLRIVTQSQNMLLAAPFGTLGAANKRKTHCPNGHEYSGSNLLVEGGRNASRKCRICTRAGERRRYAAVKVLTDGKAAASAEASLGKVAGDKLP